jgi:hypothetical protein
MVVTSIDMVDVIIAFSAKRCNWGCWTLGAGLIEPQGRECLPQPEFLAWHRAEVFKEPARE